MADLSKLVNELSSLTKLEAAELARLLDQKWHSATRARSSKMLFDDKQRARTAPMKPGEKEFAFYDASARPEYQTYRDLLNTWIEEMSEDGRAEAIARFQKGNSLQYRALFVGFAATMAECDFSQSCIIGYGSSPSRYGPVQHATQLTWLLVDREISRFPHKKRTHMPGSATTPGRLGTRG